MNAYRHATENDVPLLARMNRELIRDEGHRNPMSLEQLERRMADWLRGWYDAILIERGGDVAGYVLYCREVDHIYLRQFYVRPECRRQGVGRETVDWLCRNEWAGHSRVRLDVLSGNAAAIAFWRAVGFLDYCTTMERPV